MKFKSIYAPLWIFALLLLFSCAPLPPKIDKAKITNSLRIYSFVDEQKTIKAIELGQKNIIELRINGEYWNIPSYLGIHYISQYYLSLKWLNRTTTILDELKLKAALKNSQLDDGSWYQVKDSSRVTGDINATIYNYWALKALGESQGSSCLNKSKEYILKMGGLSKASLATKLFLATFGSYNWDDIPYIPSIVIGSSEIFGAKAFGQWVSPHMKPFYYLRKNTVKRILGPAFDLSELNSEKYVYEQSRNTHPDEKTIKVILDDKQHHGNWGGYASAAVLSIMALDHYNSLLNDRNIDIDKAIQDGQKFIEELYFESGESSYKGVVSDGRFWDTALLGYSLLVSGYDKGKLKTSASFLTKQQNVDGGFPFGNNFWRFPDNDDTSIIMVFLNRIGGYESQVSSALEFLVKMQNKDGGWGAFSKDNNGNLVLKLFAFPFIDSTDLFDESSPDITGHVLDALGTLGYNLKDELIRKAISYLKNAQDPLVGAWTGRWGVNYIYGTHASIAGLLAVGVNPNEKYIKKAIIRLLSMQNDDGGFGESTLSYKTRKWACKGKSTPTQTAWVLSTLTDVGYGNTKAANDAANYLIDQITYNRKWVDSSVVGTGHPKIVYIQYPSYAYAYPLIALSKYRKIIP